WKQRDAAEYFEKILTLTSSDASQIFDGESRQKITCSYCHKENNTDGRFWHLPLELVASYSERLQCAAYSNGLVSLQTETVFLIVRVTRKDRLGDSKRPEQLEQDKMKMMRVRGGGRKEAEAYASAEKRELLS
ncbi:unnamed protein product, partial [Pleuronectes platessa]